MKVRRTYYFLTNSTEKEDILFVSNNFLSFMKIRSNDLYREYKQILLKKGIGFIDSNEKFHLSGVVSPGSEFVAINLTTPKYKSFKALWLGGALRGRQPLITLEEILENWGKRRGLINSFKGIFNIERVFVEINEITPEKIRKFFLEDVSIHSSIIVKVSLGVLKMIHDMELFIHPDLEFLIDQYSLQIYPNIFKNRTPRVFFMALSLEEGKYLIPSAEQISQEEIDGISSIIGGEGTLYL